MFRKLNTVNKGKEPMNKIILASLLFGSTAFADQAAYIEKSQAHHVQEVLKTKKAVRYLCEPCGEKKSQLVSIEKVTIADVNYKKQWEVSINDAPIDLAYTYINVNGVWENLALYVNEKVDSVSRVLDKNTHF